MQADTTARYSRYLIYIILAVLPLERIPSFELAGPVGVTIRISQVVGLALILMNLPEMWRKRHLALRQPWIWLTIFLFICILSTGLSVDLKRSVSVTLYTGFDILLAWVIALRFERDKVAQYLKILGLSALAVCAFGLYQFFGDLFGLSTNFTGLRTQYTKAIFGFPRIQSTGLEPLYFGNFLLISASLLAMAVALGYKRRIAVLSLIPIMVAILLTVSRGAIVAVALAIGAAVLVSLYRRLWRNSALLIGMSAISIGLTLGLLYIGTHYTTVQDQAQGTKGNAIETFSKQTTNVSKGESSEGRGITRKIAYNAFKSSPIIGIGPGNFGSYAAKADPLRFSGDAGIVNNETFELLAETGLLGLGSIILFGLSLLWRIIKQPFARPIDRVWVYGLITALLAIVAQYQTFSTLYITHVWVAIGLLAGALAIGNDHRKPAKG